MAGVISVRAKPEEYKFRIIDFKLYDGDTFYCHCVMEANIEFDVGFERFITTQLMNEEKFTVRLFGFDTPELRDKRPRHKAAGYLAKEKVVEWVKMAQVRGDCYFLSEGYKKGKYGRPLGDLIDSDGNRVSTYLVANHLAVPYHGQSKADIQAQHEQNIAALVAAG